MNTIRCTHCGKEIEISEALSHELKASYEQDYQKKLEQAQKDVEGKVRKELLEKGGLELADLKKQLDEKSKKVDEMREQEIKLRNEKRRLEDKEKEMNLELERRMDEERKKVEEKVLREESERQRLKEAEKDKVINDLKVALEDAQRKASQGSQQLQGEVQELDLEVNLREVFPDDEIIPIGKGVNGADIRQIVKTKRGNACGEILWESKRTKAWGGDWADKLKGDVRAQKATMGIIISSVLPKDLKTTFGFWEGIYVTTYECYLPLVEVLRQKLIEVAYQKFVSQNRGEKADILYEFVTSHEFRQQVEALAEVYQESLEQITKERAAFERSWKARESQARRILLATSSMYGSMQGIVGGSMPQIKAFDLFELEDGK